MSTVNLPPVIPATQGSAPTKKVSIICVCGETLVDFHSHVDVVWDALWGWDGGDGIWLKPDQQDCAACQCMCRSRIYFSEACRHSTRYLTHLFPIIHPTVPPSVSSHRAFPLFQYNFSSVSSLIILATSPPSPHSCPFFSLSVPLSASVFPIFRRVELVKVILVLETEEGGEGMMQLCATAALDNCRRTDGWMIRVGTWKREKDGECVRRKRRQNFMRPLWASWTGHAVPAHVKPDGAPVCNAAICFH